MLLRKATPNAVPVSFYPFFLTGCMPWHGWVLAVDDNRLKKSGLFFGSMPFTFFGVPALLGVLQ